MKPKAKSFIGWGILCADAFVTIAVNDAGMVAPAVYATRKAARHYRLRGRTEKVVRINITVT